MGSYLQDIGADKNTKSRPNNTDASPSQDHEAYLFLVASAYNTPVAQVMKTTAAYAGAYTPEVKLFAVLQSPALVEMSAASAIKPAESIAIGASPTFLRTALTANLIASDQIPAQRAAVDPSCRNYGQCDAAPVIQRTNNDQPIIDHPVVYRPLPAETLPAPGVQKLIAPCLVSYCLQELSSRSLLLLLRLLAQGKA